jgi:hypothetical protein
MAPKPALALVEYPKPSGEMTSSLAHGKTFRGCGIGWQVDVWNNIKMSEPIEEL